jgi:ABC-type sugar transport system ATPase subunit
MAGIALDRLAKTYPGGHAAVRDVTLAVADGEFLVLVGPAGCGKSTLLRLVAGLGTPEGGRVLLDDEDVTPLPPQARDLAMVFQSYALYPHMTVRENLAYGLRVRRTDRKTIAARIAAVAEALGLEPLLGRRPAQLSGGQRQRVALGRAMVREPRAFLFDEPLSNLDPALRVQARTELLRLQRRLKTTAVYVTHDQEEAMTLGTRVAVMREGRIEQAAPPMDLYDNPANTFVAQFIGSPPMNLFEASLGGIDAPPGTLAGIRPHDIVFHAEARMKATVQVVEPRGPDALVHLSTPGAGTPPLVAVVAGQPPAVGALVGVGMAPGRVHLFDSRGRRVRPTRDGNDASA